MKGHLVCCFLLLAATFAAATDQIEDDILLQQRGQGQQQQQQQQQEQQQTPAPPTDDPSGQKQQGKPGPSMIGQCPAMSTAIHLTASYCPDIGPCPGDEKCCQIGNVKKCTLPKGVHHGYCPRPQDQAVYKKPCAGDHQCEWHEKCCWMDGQRKCVTAVPGVTGLCPKTRLPRLFTHCRNQYDDDCNCHSGKKCCFHWCGLQCVDPERHPEEGRDQEQNQNQEQNQEQHQEQHQDKKKEKDGDTEIPGESRGTCHIDRDCPHRKKCCRGVCQVECQPIDTCQLPKKQGPCMAFMPRWFYNKYMRKCEYFVYGGCQGNANNFETLNECELRCVLPDVNKPGKCPTIISDSDIPRGKYCSNDASCPGSERCCATSYGQECTILQGGFPGYCPAVLLPPRVGEVCFPNCTKDYDCNHGLTLPWKKCCVFADRKICVESIEEHPGMCPRRVEVQTLVPCNNTCSDDQDCPLTEKCCFTGCSRGCLPSVRTDVCQLPLKEGSCKEKLPRYYYDLEKKGCVSFTYLGCEGNRNNFETKQLCEEACGKISKEVCKLPADPGYCEAYSPQYYYNWNTKRCEIFIYGCCDGNGNRFSTKLECEMVCGEFDQQQHPKE